MDTTAFPPFNLSVTAVDQLSRLGRNLRIALDLGYAGSVEVTVGPPEAEDELFGCPGLDLAVEPEVFIWLSGNTLDYSPVTDEFFVAYPEARSTASRVRVA